MGWIISLILLFVSLTSKKTLAEVEITLVASAIFAVAGSIAYAAVTFKSNDKK